MEEKQMKLFIPVENNDGLNSKLDARFGRAGYFLIYDMEKQEVESVEANPYKDVDHGVGIKVASYAVGTGCTVAVGAQPGPKAAAVLKKINMKVVEMKGGTVKEAIEKVSGMME
jgi:predicted Fe-Mo cluster-binding NifX family protein